MFAANRFDLLGEDESGDGAVTRPIPVQQAKKEDKPAAKAPAKPVKKEEAKPARKPEVGDNKAVKSDRPSGERRPRREERAEEPADTKGSAVAAGNGSPATERPYRPRSDRPFNGERRERRERENAAGAGAPGNRRVFDRRSGTGRGREDKRGGAGRGNWGSLTDEKAVPATEEKPEGATEEAAGEEAAAEPTEAAAEPAEQAPPRELSPEELARIAEREKEEKLMTLDEYLKIKKGVDIPLPEQRKAGEGEDSAQWAKFIAAKSDKNEDEEKAGGSAKPKEKKAKEPKAQAAPALLRFRSEAAQRRDAERRERNQRFRDQQQQDRPERPARAPAAPRPAAAAKPDAAFQLEADFPALKA